MESTPLELGARVRDSYFKKTGIVMDRARQYAHPQAKPVFQYLIRWDDGMVQALGEAAFRRGFGLEILGGSENDS